MVRRNRITLLKVIFEMIFIFIIKRQKIDIMKGWKSRYPENKKKGNCIVMGRIQIKNCINVNGVIYTSNIELPVTAGVLKLHT